MEPILSLPPAQFRAALAELNLPRDRADALRRQYRLQNSPLAGLYGLLDRAGQGEEGMEAATFLPVSRPEGMSVADAIRSGEAGIAVPQGLLDAVGGVARALDAPSAAAAGLIPSEDMVGEALGTAGMAMGAGGLLTRPEGSVGMGGRVVDFEQIRQQRQRDDFMNFIQGVADDVQSGGYQRRLDEAAFAAHQEGLLPLQIGTRVAPPQSYDMPGSWQISGYFVDPNNPRRFGYKLESDAGDTYDAMVSDPQLGLSLDDPTRFGGGFRAFAGPRGEALQYQNLPQAPQGAIGRDIDPSERARIDEEYRQMFGDDLSANRSGTAGLLASAASESPAQRVARLLRNGHADEVTDDLMAQVDPQEMYRLYVAGETGMDLPMDEASRMARASEMGFDTAAYHATRATEDFAAFRPGVRGSVYMAATPDAAMRGATGQALENPYAPPGSQSVTATLPLNVRSSDIEGLGVNAEAWRALPEVVDGDDALRALQPQIEGVGAQYWDDVYLSQPRGDGFRYYRNDPPAVSYADLEPGRDVFGYRLPGWNSGSDVPYLNRVAERGRSGFLVSDEAGSSIVASPTMPIRSRFARFDPRLSHLANLNAANIDPLTGAAAMGASQQQQDPLASLRAYLAATGGVLGR